MLGAIVPVLVYYAGRRLGVGMVGAALAAAWGVGISVWFFVRDREVDGFSAIGAAYCLAELAGLAVTRNPDWYLLSPIVSNTAMGCVFVASMAFRRPLIQLLAEQTAGKDAFPDSVRESGYYRSLWLRLSVLWGGAYFLRALGLWIILKGWPMEVYLAARVVLDWPVVAALIALSFWYPKIYWRQRLHPVEDREYGE
ncbi:VC0807 family protein [Desulfovibrio caledoniensis]